MDIGLKEPETLEAAWHDLAKQHRIKLPEGFINILVDHDTTNTELAWRILPPDEAEQLQTELYKRYPLSERSWLGLPFAVSTTSEDVVCFDLTTPRGEEAYVLPIRDWHGPRWEYMGEKRDFDDWLKSDYMGHLT